MTSFAEFSVRRPLGVMIGIIAIVLFGLLSISQLPVLFLPVIESPSLTVVIPFFNSNPDEIQQHVAIPVESAIAGMNRVNSVSSTISSNSARIRIELSMGTKMDLAKAEIRDRIDRVRSELPAGIGRIRVSHFSTSDIPIMQFSVAGEGDRVDLERVTEDVIVPQLKRLDGVADVEVRGLQKEEVIIDLDPEVMDSFGVTVEMVVSRLNSNNVDIAGGYLMDSGQRRFVRLKGAFTDVTEIANLLITGSLRVQDLGSIRQGVRDSENLQQLNLEESVTLRVFKESDSNVVKVAQAARAQLVEINRNYPDVKTFIFFDQSEAITTSLKNLRDSGLIGAGLAVIVLFAFLKRVRATLVVAIAIPVSVITTFAVVFLIRRSGALDISINVISLSGLMLAIGMLVDNSVVVLENIFRYREQGLEKKEAAIRGTREVTTPVIAATMTSIVVFIPILFTANTPFGRFLSDFAATLVAAMIASLLISLSLVPVVSSRFLLPAKNMNQRSTGILLTIYREVLSWTLSHRLITVSLMVCILSLGFYMITLIEREFMPSSPARRMSIVMTAENGLTLAENKAVIEAFGKDLLSQSKALEIDAVTTNVSSRTSNLTVYFRDDVSSLRATADLTNEVRGMLPKIPGYTFSVGQRHGRAGGNALGVSVDITGPNIEMLSLFAGDIAARLDALPGVDDVSTNLESGNEQLHVKIDRDQSIAADLTASSVGSFLNANLGENKAGIIEHRGKEIPILIRIAEDKRTELSGLSQLLIKRNGFVKPLGSVATFERQPGPRSIRRFDGSQVVSVTANTDRQGMIRLSNQIESLLSDQQLPSGYSAEVGRNFQRFYNSEQTSFFSLLIAAAFIYLIMAALFESLIHPVTILCSLPFSLLGVAVVFYLTGTTLNASSWLGIMVLAGVVVNNGIILIDRINQLRSEELTRREAIIAAGQDRLRPILITAFTTILGLLPMMAPLVVPSIFGPVEGRAGIWGPMALAVVGGLTTSTFMTLVIMPTIYTLFDDFANYSRRLISSLGRWAEELIM